ncbi:Radical SAM [hydrothermal vent metagenome]|uniref:Radical SAM n=1 Tax=hydrothermal vent metagenome TaxID=652676 RepID=A0A3B0YZD2_9ZZZZ
MRDVGPLLQDISFPAIKRSSLRTLQVNLGYLCNQRCLHCHVNAGPTRTEIMQAETIALVKQFIRNNPIEVLDLTGGAPEMNPHFRELIKFASDFGLRVIDRCNLTILREPGMEGLAEYMAQHKIEITASMPCYLKDNVDNQRGSGVFDISIEVLQHLNSLGYGKPGSDLILNLVFNPQQATLPPPQAALEQDYKTYMQQHYHIEFHELLTLTNMPIKRFGSTLLSKGDFNNYMDLLKLNHAQDNLKSVMCRSTISVDWRGYIYDCDFNQMLELPLTLEDNSPMHLSGISHSELLGNTISVAGHCYGCTAGQGSSCGGAL